MDDRLLSARDVARLLHISLSYAYALMSRGEIRTVQVGNLVRVRPQDLESYIEVHRKNSFALPSRSPH